MSPLLFAAFLLFQSPATAAPTLDARLLLDHPALATGDFAAVREDWLRGLEADPSSPYATAVCRLLPALTPWCENGIDPSRLQRLSERIANPEASYALRTQLLAEVRRQLFAPAAFTLPDDLFADFITEWELVGPLGPLDEPNPLLVAAPVSPETHDAPSYFREDGRELHWQSLTRKKQSSSVTAREHLFPRSGAAYLRTTLDIPTGGGVLELRTRLPFAAFLDGEVQWLQERFGPSPTRVYLPLEPGKQQLLIKLHAGADGGLAARILPPGFLPASESWTESASEADRLLALTLARLDGRPDRALAASAPTDPSLHRAWLRIRFTALSETNWLPAETARRLSLEVEAAIDESGRPDAVVGLARVRRLLEEDKLSEAALLADRLAASFPDSPLPARARVEVAEKLDSTSTLAIGPLADLLERFPNSAAGWRQMVYQCQQANDLDGARKAARRAMSADASHRWAQDRCFELLLPFEEGREEIESWLLRWRAEEPFNGRLRALRARLWEWTGQLDVYASNLERRAWAEPHRPDLWRALGGVLLKLERNRAAVEAFRKALALQPSHHGVRRVLGFLGEAPDDASAFFETFAPDREAALSAASVDASGSSTSMVLDSYLLYLHPDGGYHGRVHTITQALSRTGTEQLHEQEAPKFILRARVLQKDGGQTEPAFVNGSLVMPSLDPGDAVELIYDSFGDGFPGVAPDPGWFRFGSFTESYRLSRYVLFVPDGLKGELREFQYDGEHEVVPWGDGTVHVFTVENSPRRTEEPARPSDWELLPWVQYGADRPLASAARGFRSFFASKAYIPDDLRVEWQAVVDALPENAEPLARAAILWDAVQERVLEFNGNADAVDAWHLKRGFPLYLLGVLYELAGLDFAWAVVESPAPELHPEPVVAFQSGDRYSLPAIRLAAPDANGDPVWVIIAGRGGRFADIPLEVAGAHAVVLTESGYREETLPRTSIESAWNLDLEVAYKLDEAGDAAVTAQVQITGTFGAQYREQIARIEPFQRSMAARQLASQFIPGVNLSGSSFPNLDQAGEPFQLSVTGTVPGFVEQADTDPRFRLRFQSLGLSTGLGSAKRTWPLALRVTQRLRTRVTVDGGEFWRPLIDPLEHTWEEEGFRYTWTVDPSGPLRVERVTAIRGLYLEAEAMPAFLDAAKRAEDREAAFVRLERIGP